MLLINVHELYKLFLSVIHLVNKLTDNTILLMKLTY